MLVYYFRFNHKPNKEYESWYAQNNKDWKKEKEKEGTQNLGGDIAE